MATTHSVFSTSILSSMCGGVGPEVSLEAKMALWPRARGPPHPPVSIEPHREEVRMEAVGCCPTVTKALLPSLPKHPLSASWLWGPRESSRSLPHRTRVQEARYWPKSQEQWKMVRGRRPEATAWGRPRWVQGHGPLVARGGAEGALVPKEPRTGRLGLCQGWRYMSQCCFSIWGLLEKLPVLDDQWELPWTEHSSSPVVKQTGTSVYVCVGVACERWGVLWGHPGSPKRLQRVRDGGSGCRARLGTALGSQGPGCLATWYEPSPGAPGAFWRHHTQWEETRTKTHIPYSQITPSSHHLGLKSVTESVGYSPRRGVCLQHHSGICSVQGKSREAGGGGPQLNSIAHSMMTHPVRGSQTDSLCFLWNQCELTAYLRELAG